MVRRPKSENITQDTNNNTTHYEVYQSALNIIGTKSNGYQNMYGEFRDK